MDRSRQWRRLATSAALAVLSLASAVGLAWPIGQPATTDDPSTVLTTTSYHDDGATSKTGDADEVVSDDSMTKTLTNGDSDDPVPSTATGTQWMNAVNAAIGLERDGLPHRLTKSDRTPYAEYSSWTEPERDGTHFVRQDDLLVLNPRAAGTYDIDVYCAGVGTVTINMVVDGQAIATSRVSCRASSPALKVVPVTVTSSARQLSVQFVAANATEAAIGFVFEDASS
ncbi:hypothetical protein [Bifidobacterium choloepi]|uniref:Uncharacterized protein n=1 Tax=Bifidobacterium choloepi TaxID=2614131 RepID=A0A6I5NKS5_9BIFI|nr:hypothetical protein [Bifidobacterium choloepi]NEG69442.1 hypothetical protein [Bifidobacterium choloepi]